AEGVVAAAARGRAGERRVHARGRVRIADRVVVADAARASHRVVADAGQDQIALGGARDRVAGSAAVDRRAEVQAGVGRVAATAAADGERRPAGADTQVDVVAPLEHAG